MIQRAVAPTGSGSRLRVLIVGAWFPYPPRWGWATRVYQLARHLATMHDVTLLTYATAEDEPNVAELAQELDVETVTREPRSRSARRLNQFASLLSDVPNEPYATRSREMQEAIDRLGQTRTFDVVQLESTLVWPFRFAPGTPLVLDEHNVDYETYARMREGERSPVRRAFYGIEESRVRRFEQRAWRSVDGCVVTSEREQEIVRAVAPQTPVTVVPNGVDIEYFRPQEVTPEPLTVVFNGTLDYRPNLDAVAHLVEDILPLVQRRHPQTRVRIVGRGGRGEVERFRRPGVEIVGEVPDVRPHLARAAVVAVPIRAGSGTRFKVVEGLAMARPMVSTTIGCEGLGVEDDEHLLIGDTAEAFATAVVRVFDDPTHADALARAGRAHVEAEFSWQQAGRRLDTLIRDVAERKQRAR